MTREEAIEILEGLAVPIHAEPAFDMAIEALKAQADLQPNCNELATDCISRQDAIDHWRLIIDATSTDSRYNMGFVDGLEFCISHLSTMPSAQPVLDRTKISDLLEKIYSIQSVHLSVEGVLARKYYCKQLWMELFGNEDVPKWID